MLTLNLSINGYTTTTFTPERMTSTFSSTPGNSLCNAASAQTLTAYAQFPVTGLQAPVGLPLERLAEPKLDEGEWSGSNCRFKLPTKGDCAATDMECCLAVCKVRPVGLSPAPSVAPLSGLLFLCHREELASCSEGLARVPDKLNGWIQSSEAAFPRIPCSLV